LISYQIEQRNKGNVAAWITQFYIHINNPKKHQFELIHSFLADINTKGTGYKGMPTIFNRVIMIREEIYYLKKK
jgi:hypothetical protein